MPNWVRTTITVRGPGPLLAGLWEKVLVDSGIDFNRIIPCPPDVESEYHWNIAHWGTKWNATDDKVNVEKNEIVFNTAWSQPIPIYDALSRQFRSLRFYCKYVHYESKDACGYVVFSRGKRFARNYTTSAESYSEILAAMNEAVEDLYDEDELPDLLAASGEDRGKEFWMEAVRRNSRAIKDVPEQDEVLCLAAVKHRGRALQFVKNQTPAVCLAAVKQDGRALQFVKEQDPEICRRAVIQDGRALQFVKEKTPELCEKALRQNAKAKRFI
jgi:hypothetical protein